MFVEVLLSCHLLFKLLIIYSFGISQKFVYQSEILNMFLMCYTYLYHKFLAQTSSVRNTDINKQKVRNFHSNFVLQFFQYMIH